MNILTSKNLDTFCKNGVIELYECFKRDFIDNQAELKKEIIVF